MGRRAPGWEWHAVNPIHHYGPACPGKIQSYVYRHYPPGHASYDRCIGIYWCSTCRQHSSAMVHVPVEEELHDPLAALPERPSGYRLLDHLDRLTRRGLWPPPRP